MYDTPPPAPGRPLREVLEEAVRRRGAGVTSDFSGGSTRPPWPSWPPPANSVEAVVYHHAHVPSADLEEARRAARLSRRIRLEVVTGDGRTLPYRGIADPEGRELGSTGPPPACWPGGGRRCG